MRPSALPSTLLPSTQNKRRSSVQKTAEGYEKMYSTLSRANSISVRHVSRMPSSRVVGSLYGSNSSHGDKSDSGKGGGEKSFYRGGFSLGGLFGGRKSDKTLPTVDDKDASEKESQSGTAKPKAPSMSMSMSMQMSSKEDPHVSDKGGGSGQPSRPSSPVGHMAVKPFHDLEAGGAGGAGGVDGEGKQNLAEIQLRILVVMNSTMQRKLLVRQLQAVGDAWQLNDAADSEQALVKLKVPRPASHIYFFACPLSDLYLTPYLIYCLASTCPLLDLLSDPYRTPI